MSEIVFLNDALMAREAFEQLPAIAGPAIATTVERYRGRLCRALIERDGKPAWHALAWLYINGAERATAARIRFGNFRADD
jgi:hypothetical protein